MAVRTGPGSGRGYQSLKDLLAHLNSEEVKYVHMGLQRFAEQSENEDPEDAGSMMRQYLASSPRLAELFSILKSEEGQSYGTASRALNLAAVLIEKCARCGDATARAAASGAAHRITRSHLRTIYSVLGAGDDRVIVAGARSLSAIAGSSVAAARLLCQKLSFTNRAVMTLAGRKSSPLAVRAAAVKLACVFLSHRDVDLTTAFLSKNYLSLVLRTMGATDPPPTSPDLLTALTKAIQPPRGAGLPAAELLFSSPAVDALLRLDGVPGDIAIASRDTTQAIAELCLAELGTRSTTKRGVTRASGRRADTARSLLLKLCLSLRAAASPAQRTLALHITSNAPSVLSKYVPALTWSFDPRPSIRWLANASLLQALLARLKFHSKDKKSALSRAPPAALVASLLPRSLTRQALSHGAQHKSSLVRFESLGLVSAACEAFGRMRDASPPSRHMALEREMAGRLPSPQTILSIYASAAGQAAKGRHGDSASRRARLICERVCRVLALYKAKFPRTFAQSNIDGWRFLKDASGAGDQFRALAAAKLLDGLHGGAAATALRRSKKGNRGKQDNDDDNCVQSGLGLTLRLAAAGPQSVRSQAKSIAVTLLQSIGAVRGEGDASLWLDCLEIETTAFFEAVTVEFSRNRIAHMRAAAAEVRGAVGAGLGCAFARCAIRAAARAYKAAGVVGRNFKKNTKEKVGAVAAAEMVFRAVLRLLYWTGQDAVALAALVVRCAGGATRAEKIKTSDSSVDNADEDESVRSLMSFDPRWSSLVQLCRSRVLMTQYSGDQDGDQDGDVWKGKGNHFSDIEKSISALDAKFQTPALLSLNTFTALCAGKEKNIFKKAAPDSASARAAADFLLSHPNATPPPPTSVPWLSAHMPLPYIAHKAQNALYNVKMPLPVPRGLQSVAVRNLSAALKESAAKAGLKRARAIAETAAALCEDRAESWLDLGRAAVGPNNSVSENKNSHARALLLHVGAAALVGSTSKSRESTGAARVALARSYGKDDDEKVDEALFALRTAWACAPAAFAEKINSKLIFSFLADAPRLRRALRHPALAACIASADVCRFRQKVAEAVAPIAAVPGPMALVRAAALATPEMDAGLANFIKKSAFADGLWGVVSCPPRLAVTLFRACARDGDAAHQCGLALARAVAAAPSIAHAVVTSVISLAASGRAAMQAQLRSPNAQPALCAIACRASMGGAGPEGAQFIALLCDGIDVWYSNAPETAVALIKNKIISTSTASALSAALARQCKGSTAEARAAEVRAAEAKVATSLCLRYGETAMKSGVMSWCTHVLMNESKNDSKNDSIDTLVLRALETLLSEAVRLADVIGGDKRQRLGSAAARFLLNFAERSENFLDESALVRARVSVAAARVVARCGDGRLAAAQIVRAVNALLVDNDASAELLNSDRDEKGTARAQEALARVVEAMCTGLVSGVLDADSLGSEELGLNGMNPARRALLRAYRGTDGATDVSILNAILALETAAETNDSFKIEARLTALSGVCERWGVHLPMEECAEDGALNATHPKISQQRRVDDIEWALRSLDPTVLRRGPRRPNTENKKSARYDPRFVLPFLARLAASGARGARSRAFIESGALAFLLRSLAIDGRKLRDSAYTALAAYYAQVEAAASISARRKDNDDRGPGIPGDSRPAPGFRESPQVLVLLTALKNAITEPGMQLSAVVTEFLARAAPILIRPDHALYRQINRFLLQRPQLDLGDVPMFYSLFGSGKSSQRSERAWLLRGLTNALYTAQDAYVLGRRHALPILMTYYDSQVADRAGRTSVAAVLRAAVRAGEGGSDDEGSDDEGSDDEGLGGNDSKDNGSMEEKSENEGSDDEGSDDEGSAASSVDGKTDDKDMDIDRKGRARRGGTRHSLASALSRHGLLSWVHAQIDDQSIAPMALLVPISILQTALRRALSEKQNQLPRYLQRELGAICGSLAERAPNLASRARDEASRARVLIAICQALRDTCALSARCDLRHRFARIEWPALEALAQAIGTQAVGTQAVGTQAVGTQAIGMTPSERMAVCLAEIATCNTMPMSSSYARPAARVFMSSAAALRAQNDSTQSAGVAAGLLGRMAAVSHSFQEMFSAEPGGLFTAAVDCYGMITCRSTPQNTPHAAIDAAAGVNTAIVISTCVQAGNSDCKDMASLISNVRDRMGDAKSADEELVEAEPALVAAAEKLMEHIFARVARVDGGSVGLEPRETRKRRKSKVSKAKRDSTGRKRKKRKRASL